MTFNPTDKKLGADTLVQATLSTNGIVATFCFNTQLRTGIIGHVSSESSDELPFALHSELADWEKTLAEKLFKVPGITGVTFKQYEIAVQMHYTADTTTVRQQAKRILESVMVSANQVAHSSFPQLIMN